MFYLFLAPRKLLFRRRLCPKLLVWVVLGTSFYCSERAELLHKNASDGYNIEGINSLFFKNVLLLRVKSFFFVLCSCVCFSRLVPYFELQDCPSGSGVVPKFRIHPRLVDACSIVESSHISVRLLHHLPNNIQV